MKKCAIVAIYINDIKFHFKRKIKQYILRKDLSTKVWSQSR